MSNPVYPRIPSPHETAEGSYEAREAATGRPLQLAMQRLWLSGTITPAGAHLFVQHTFRHDELKPVEVVYAFALPRDAALRRFLLRGENFEIHSELQSVEDARAAYENAIDEGSLAAHVREYRDGLVNLSLGNLRPDEEVSVTIEILSGVEARDQSLRFRFPFTVAPTYHREARFVACPDGAGEMEVPSSSFGDVLMPRWFRDAAALHAVGFQLDVKGLATRVSSPSHRVTSEALGKSTKVTILGERDVPDRDLVIDVTFDEAMPLAFAGNHVGRSTGKECVEWIAHLPSLVFGETKRKPLDVVFVVDCSGSMSGLPMEQAKVGLKACLGCMEAGDRFSMIAFGSHWTAFASQLKERTAPQMEEARIWVDSLQEMGGTEIGPALAAAAGMLKPDGVVFLLTDGQVSGTDEILEPLRGSPVRVHVLGIGAASQDRFLAAVAEATSGTSRFVSPRERVDQEAIELFAEAGERVATDVAVKSDGMVFHQSGSTVFAGRPLLAYGRTETSQNEGVSSISLQAFWTTADGEKIQRLWDLPVEFLGDAAPLLAGAKRISLLSQQSLAERFRQDRESARTDRALAALSTEYGLASTAMSLVGVIARTNDVPGAVPRTVVVPVGMPQDTAFDAYFTGNARVRHGYIACGFLDRVIPSAPAAPNAMPLAEPPAPSIGALAEPGSPLSKRGLRRPPLRGLFWGNRMESSGTAPQGGQTADFSSPPKLSAELPDLAARMEADGGMPGNSLDERLRATLHALLRFVAGDNAVSSGPYRVVVRRMVEFVKSNLPAEDHRREIVRTIVELAEGVSGADAGVEGNRHSPLSAGNGWAQLEAAVRERKQ